MAGSLSEAMIARVRIPENSFEPRTALQWRSRSIDAERRMTWAAALEAAGSRMNFERFAPSARKAILKPA